MEAYIVLMAFTPFQALHAVQVNVNDSLIKAIDSVFRQHTRNRQTQQISPESPDAKLATIDFILGKVASFSTICCSSVIFYTELLSSAPRVAYRIVAKELL